MPEAEAGRHKDMTIRPQRNTEINFFIKNTTFLIRGLDIYRIEHVFSNTHKSRYTHHLSGIISDRHHVVSGLIDSNNLADAPPFHI